MTSKEKRQLATRWAPIHYQRVNAEYSRGELITKINFNNGSWKTNGNWKALKDTDDSNLTGAVYYAITETVTHWHIIYAFYHARDWDNLFRITHHENDIEGFLAVIQKPPTAYDKKYYPHGIYLAMITLAHDQYTSYANILTKNRGEYDGEIKFEKADDGLYRPCSYQEPMSHGCLAFKSRRQGAPYYRYQPLPPGKKLETPEKIVSSDTNIIRDAYYELIDMTGPNGLWARRWIGKLNRPFTLHGQIHGTHEGVDKASPPWNWNDKDDGPDLQKGTIAYDPAYLVSEYFSELTVDDSKGFFEYVDYPYIPLTGKLYGEDITEEILTDKLDSGDDYESFAAATQMLLKGGGNKKIAGRFLNAVVKKKLLAEALSIILREINNNSVFKNNIKSGINDIFNSLKLFDTSEQLIPLIRIAAAIHPEYFKPAFRFIYPKSKDRHIILAAARALAGLDKQTSEPINAFTYSHLNDSDEIRREAGIRVFMSWYAQDDNSTLNDLVKHKEVTVRQLVVEYIDKLSAGQKETILKKFLQDKSWVLKARAARMLIENYQNKGLTIVSQYLKSELEKAKKLAVDKASIRPELLSDHPLAGEKDQYGQTCLIATMAEAIANMA